MDERLGIHTNLEGERRNSRDEGRAGVQIDREKNFITVRVGANVKAAIFDNSQMNGVNLRLASLRGSSLRSCNLRYAIMAGTDMEVRNRPLLASKL